MSKTWKNLSRTVKRANKAPACLVFTATLAILITGCAVPKWVFHQAPSRGKPFPTVILRVTDSDAYREYLGIDSKEVINLDTIEADVAIVFLFDFYCRYCQNAAPQAIEIYKKIQPYPNIKMIGIALENSEYEANLYRKKFDIPFPIFADPEGANRALMGRVGTPSFYAVCLNNGSREIVHMSSGIFLKSEGKTPETFVAAAVDRLKECSH